MRRSFHGPPPYRGTGGREIGSLIGSARRSSKSRSDAVFFGRNNSGASESTTTKKKKTGSPAFVPFSLFDVFKYSVPDPPPSSLYGDELEWQLVGADETEERDGTSRGSPIFGSVPSEHEVLNAMSSIRRVTSLDESDIGSLANDSKKVISSNPSVSDWKEPCLELSASSPEKWNSNEVYTALGLVQTDPSLQKMVVSLSCDAAVWDAVMNNAAVKEMRDEYVAAADDRRLPWSSGSNDGGGKGKIWIVELLEKVRKLASQLFSSMIVDEKRRNGEADDDSSETMFHEKIRSALLMTVLVLLTVVLGRIYRPRP